MRSLANVVIASTAFAVVAVAAQEAAAIQCARYARIAGPVKIRGDAWTWWDKAVGTYARTRKPRAGSVIVFSKTQRNRFGHVAVVSDVIDDRQVLVYHANWLNSGRVYKDQLVVDVSEAGDWSKVRVWHPRLDRMGKHHFPVEGFIDPLLPPDRDEFLRPDAVMVAHGISETATAPKTTQVAQLPAVPQPKPSLPSAMIAQGDIGSAEAPSVEMAAADTPAAPPPKPVTAGRRDDEPRPASVQVAAADDPAPRHAALEKFGLTTGPVARFLSTTSVQAEPAETTVIQASPSQRTTVIAATEAAPSQAPDPATAADTEIAAASESDGTVMIATLPASISDTARARAAAEAFGLTTGPVAKFLPQLAAVPAGQKP